MAFPKIVKKPAIKKVSWAENQFSVLADNEEENEEINAVTRAKNWSWLEDGWLLDSGSDVHAVPEGMFQAEVQKSEKGAKMVFDLADGTPMRASGSQEIECVTKEGKKVRLTAVVAPVTRPILSVGLLIDKGIKPDLRTWGGFLYLPDGSRVKVKRVKNTYVVDTKVLNGGYSADF